MKSARPSSCKKVKDYGSVVADMRGAILTLAEGGPGTPPKAAAEAAASAASAFGSWLTCEGNDNMKSFNDRVLQLESKFYKKLNDSAMISAENFVNKLKEVEDHFGGQHQFPKEIYDVLIMDAHSAYSKFNESTVSGLANRLRLQMDILNLKLLRLRTIERKSDCALRVHELVRESELMTTDMEIILNDRSTAMEKIYCDSHCDSRGGNTCSYDEVVSQHKVEYYNKCTLSVYDGHAKKSDIALYQECHKSTIGAIRPTCSESTENELNQSMKNSLIDNYGPGYKKWKQLVATDVAEFSKIKLDKDKILHKHCAIKH